MFPKDLKVKITLQNSIVHSERVNYRAARTSWPMYVQPLCKINNQ